MAGGSKERRIRHDFECIPSMSTECRNEAKKRLTEEVGWLVGLDEGACEGGELGWLVGLDVGSWQLWKSSRHKIMYESI